MEPEWVSSPSMQDESVHSEDKLFRQEKSFNRARRKRGRQQANMVAMGAPFSKVMCVFHLVTAFTCLLALLICVVNCYTVYRSFKIDDDLEVQEDVIRVFGVVLSVLVIMAELEIKAFMRYFAFMHSWMARGLTYAFIGVLSYNAKVKFEPGYGAFNASCACMMVAVGVLYFLLGLSCMKTVKEVEARASRQNGSKDSESDEEF